MSDIEELWTRLAAGGVSAMVKIDHERFAEGGRPWTLLLSGPPLGDGFVRAEEASLRRCLEVGLTRLADKAEGEWGWVSEYLG
ncbi:hypothetical protein ACFWUU_16415 [Kribbella sp. NPDC058693]|uniref:Uncharacterized protein n=1 Tax=Kribbella jiaozuonensis TaxID=2575441 RepID=A0A4U3LYW3_9ACTN|nr:hypothetical protein [Kribbella jiaozuonensis]TKK80027.1 hypothetical protein FDA38_16910 [Kribbella jiaozuonensis]